MLRALFVTLAAVDGRLAVGKHCTGSYRVRNKQCLQASLGV